MKAVICRTYGPSSNLRIEEIPPPKPKPHEVLVKVYASAINDYDWSMVRGKPLLYRLLFGILRPKHLIPGMELSGVIAAIGSDATIFRTGDAVYGDISEYGFGTLAEFVCIDERALVKKPQAITFDEAATVSHASMLAWQALHDHGKMKGGEKVLINGAGGGVGIFALQLAKLLDAEVTGVDSGHKLKAMKELGYDQVIDYRKEDFAKLPVKYDLILDCKTSRSPFAYADVLKRGGRYVTVGGRITKLLQLLLWRRWIQWTQNKQFRIVALKPNKDLVRIHQLFEDRQLRCLIDGPYPLTRTPELIQYFGDGKHTGKVVISLIQN